MILEIIVKKGKNNDIINNKLYYRGVSMIWLYLLIPVVIIGGIAIYYEKKTGMTIPDENIQAAKLGEIVRHNSKGPGGC